MSEPNGKPAQASLPGNATTFTLTITWDVAKDEFNVTGLNIPPWVALGMLRFMEILVRRREVEAAMRASIENAPRIARPGGLQ
jgi:hypothetical protein